LPHRHSFGTSSQIWGDMRNRAAQIWLRKFSLLHLV
jgi:hypothetical protein